LPQVAGQYLNDDDGFPCADFALLKPLKRSAEYGAIRRRVADPKPLDAWQVDGLHYFVFALRPPEGAPTGEAPVALFTMTGADEDPPAVALVITPGVDPKHPQVVDLRRPGTPFTVPL
jgi:hypothetical protein